MLQFVEIPMNASGKYTNASNEPIFIYAQQNNVTMTDAAGNTVSMQATPGWLPPGFTITGGVGVRLWGLQGQFVEFAGFLLSRSAAALAAGSIKESWLPSDNEAPLNALSEVWTHN